jgi:phosphate transport system permease protein
MPTADSLTSATAAYSPEAQGLRAPAGDRIDYRSRPPLGRVDGRRRRVGADWILSALVRGSAAMVLLLMAALICVLGYSALPSLKTFGPRFLVTATWRPNELEHVKRDAQGKIVKDADGEPVTETLPPVFGALPVIYGTAVSSLLALCFAVPLSLGSALFLVRIAPRRLAGGASFLIEFLAAIPSIAYGLWGLFVLAPFLQSHVEPFLNNFFAATPGLRWLHSEATTGRDMFCGGLILGIMILPIITAVSRDVLKAVPRVQIEGTLALGATWWQSCREMLRYSRSGLFGAIMLGLARAAGETMAVTMVIGNINQIARSPFAAAQTMSSLLANEFAEAGSDLQRAALLEVALILLLMSLAFNVVARWLVVGKQARSAAAH